MKKIQNSLLFNCITSQVQHITTKGKEAIHMNNFNLEFVPTSHFLERMGRCITITCMSQPLFRHTNSKFLQ